MVALHDRYKTVEEALRALPHLPTNRRMIGYCILHCTSEPDHRAWAKDKTGGLNTIKGMFSYWKQRQEDEGWQHPIAYHYLIAPSGIVYRLADLGDVLNASSNTRMNENGLAVSMVGEFDTGHDVLEGAQHHAAIGLCAGIMHHFALDISRMHFHREFNHAKTCPGSSLSEGPVKAQIQAARPWARDIMTAVSLTEP